MDAELLSLLGYLAGALAIGGIFTGVIMIVKRARYNARVRKEAMDRALDSYARTRASLLPRIAAAPAVALPPAFPKGKHYVPGKAVHPSPAPAAAAPSSGIDPLTAGVIGYAIGSMSHHDSPAPAPESHDFESGGGSFGGGGSSESWDSGSSSSDSGGSFSSDSGGGSFGGC